MIVAIEGIITKKEPTNCVIKLSNGISYSVNISLNCSAKLEKNAKMIYCTRLFIVALFEIQKVGTNPNAHH